MTTLEKLRLIFEREFKTSLPDFSLELQPGDLPDWNSVAHVTLIMDIEQAFNIEFSTEELGSLENVRAIHSALETKCG